MTAVDPAALADYPPSDDAMVVWVTPRGCPFCLTARGRFLMQLFWSYHRCGWCGEWFDGGAHAGEDGL